jgi:hypothetical protein
VKGRRRRGVNERTIGVKERYKGSKWAWLTFANAAARPAKVAGASAGAVVAARTKVVVLGPAL